MPASLSSRTLELARRLETKLGLRPRPDAHRRLEELLRSGDEQELWDGWDGLEAYSVPESYFERHENQFAFLETWARAGLAQWGPAFRVWSAGCAGGEELYSTLLRLLPILEVRPELKCEFFGTDMSAAAIARAQEARYTAWSLRSSPTHYRQAYFDALEDGRFELKSRYRKLASFARAAVGSRLQEFPDHSLQLVMFRNVSVYLEAETVSDFYAAVSRKLAPGGLLLTAPADQQPAVSGLAAVAAELAGVYLRRAEQEPIARTFGLRELVAGGQLFRGEPAAGTESGRASSTAPAASEESLSKEDTAAGHRASPPSSRRGSVQAELEEVKRLVAAEAWAEARTQIRYCLYLYPHDHEARFWSVVVARGIGDVRVAEHEAKLLLSELKLTGKSEELLAATLELLESLA